MLISESRAAGMVIPQRGQGADEYYVRMHQEREGRALSRQRQRRGDESLQGSTERAGQSWEVYAKEADDAKMSPRKQRSRSQSPRFHRSSSPIMCRWGRASEAEKLQALGDEEIMRERAKLQALVDEEIMRERANSAAGESQKG